jgi:hypothetical protein
MDQPRRLLSKLTPLELSRRAIEYRRMAITAHGQTTKLALDKLAIRFALLAARREVEEASVIDPMAQQKPSELEKLVRLAEHAGANQVDPVRALADTIKTVADGDADPYLVMGVLVEGAIHTLGSRIPIERQWNTGAALLNLMVDRLQAKGVLGNP